MLRKSGFVLVLLLISTLARATLFIPLPFEKQVEEATSAVEVSLASSKVFKDAMGSIMTEYSFDILESYNLSKADIEDHKLRLTMPGGTFEGITSVIDGAPQFSLHEKSFLLLKKIDSKIYLSNFTLGKFKIEDHEGKTIYRSEVFPTDPKIGQIAKEKMIELMEDKWKTTFSYEPGAMIKPVDETPSVKMVRAVFKNEERRKPAQEEESSEVPYFFWAALLVFVVMFALIFIKIGKNGAINKSE